jgi:repressor LexA
MIDALIDDGDIILIDPTPTIQDGDMVVAWLKLEQETTLKRIYREGRVIRLQPENSAMQPIFAKASNIETMGKVVGVVRTL